MSTPPPLTYFCRRAPPWTVIGVHAHADFRTSTWESTCMLSVKSPGWMETKSWVLSAYRWWLSENEQEWTGMSSVGCKEKRSKCWAMWYAVATFVSFRQVMWISLRNANRRSEKYDLNVLSVVPSIPNHRDKRFERTARWVVSKAADRSSKQRHVTWWCTIALIRWSWSERRTVSVEWNLR